MPRKYDEKMFDIKHLRETAEKLKNWGRWGPDDEKGTLNFITPDKVVEIRIIVAKTEIGITTDCIPTERPEIITVADPVSPDSAIF